MESWSLFFSALGIAIFLEGLPYFVSPPAVRRFLEQMTQLGDGTLRIMGFTLMTVGLLVTYVSLH